MQRKLAQPIPLIVMIAVALALLPSSAAAQHFEPDPDLGYLYIESAGNGTPPSGSRLDFVVSSPCLDADVIVSTSVATTFGNDFNGGLNGGAITWREFSEIYDDDGALCSYTVTPPTPSGFLVIPSVVEFEFRNSPYAESYASFSFIGVNEISLQISHQAFDITESQFSDGPPWYPDTWTYDTIPDAFDFVVTSSCLGSPIDASVPRGDNPIYADPVVVPSLPVVDPSGVGCIYDVTNQPADGWTSAPHRTGLTRVVPTLPYLQPQAGFLMVREDDGGPLPTICDGRPASIDLNLNGGNGFGTPGDDVIVGTSGDDTIYGRGGNDTICAGGGDDIVFAGHGDDRVFGEGGDDILLGSAGRDMLDGSVGDDTLIGQLGVDLLFGRSGNDVMKGMGSQDLLWGGGGNDRLFGNGGVDKIWGGPGLDQIWGGAGGDFLYGEGTRDIIRGGAGPDVIDGGSGDNDCPDVSPGDTVTNC